MDNNFQHQFDQLFQKIFRGCFHWGPGHVILALSRFPPGRLYTTHWAIHTRQFTKRAGTGNQGEI